MSDTGSDFSLLHSLIFTCTIRPIVLHWFLVQLWWHFHGISRHFLCTFCTIVMYSLFIVDINVSMIIIPSYNIQPYQVTRSCTCVNKQTQTSRWNNYFILFNFILMNNMSLIYTAHEWVTTVFGHSWHIFDNETRQLVIVFIM
jgi:hypothetical protein